MPQQSRLAQGLNGVLGKTIDRRTFLKRSGLTAGAGVAATQLPFSMIGEAQAKDAPAGKTEIKRTVCTHCSVGCAIDAVVQDGVWIRQEPVFDSPINLGAHCAKGASIREHGITHDSHRLKYPMKLEGGKWKRISWDTAYDEISKKLLTIRDDKEKGGPDSLFVVGSSKHNNEQSYLLRKWVSLWGTNNCDHQARICHSTTVAGVAQTWGYGAMTNSYNDEQNSKSLFFLGSNAAEAHPVSMLHTLHAKENGCKVIVADPRYTRTAAKADIYVRFRSGTDVPLIFGVLYHIFKNGWEDKQYIHDRVYGMEDVKKEVLAKWTPDKVTEATGCSEAEIANIAKTLAENRPGFIIWAMGQTQHNNANGVVRASNILMLALGNVGRSGGGCNIYRGHDNVQGATDVGPNPDTLPGYYPVAVPGSWAHWSRVWNVDPKWIAEALCAGHAGQARHDGVALDRRRAAEGRHHRPAEQPARDHLLGPCAEQPVARHRDGQGDGEARPDGGGRSVSVGFGGDVRDGAQGRRLPAAGGDAAGDRGFGDGLEPLDPVAREGDRPAVRVAHRPHDHVPAGAEARLCRPVRRQRRTASRTSAWSRPRAAWKSRRWKTRCAKSTAAPGPSATPGSRPSGCRRTCATCTSSTSRRCKAKGGKDAKTGYDLTGDYFGLPWPCYGTAAIKHPGSPNLYDTSKTMMEGGGNFRALFGVEKDGVNLLAEDGSAPKGAEITTGHPQFDHVFLKKLGWWDDLTEDEKKEAEGKTWANDLSGGIQRVAMKHGNHPFGNAKARAIVWNFPDGIPQHREPLYSPRAGHGREVSDA